MENIVESYQKSSQHLEDMASHMGHFIKHGFQYAVSQTKWKGFSEKLSLARANAGITPSSYFKGDLEALLDRAW